eukprot:10523316-Lingulodinium_polyedra.AAC.1
MAMPGSSLGAAVVQIPEFLLWLASLNSQLGWGFLSSCLVWLGKALEAAPGVAAASDDPTDAPVLRGSKKTRRLDDSLKQEIASMGSCPAMA